MLAETTEAAAGFYSPIRRMVARLGAAVWVHWTDLRHVAAVIGTVFGETVRPSSWAPSTPKAFARQVLAIGMEPLLFVGAVAVFVGISVVVQLTFWMGEAGQSELIGPLLVIVVARELGPLLINLIVIMRSGSAMTTELGILKANGYVAALEARGGDPFSHLVLPRVLGMAVSTLCLTLVFIPIAFMSGYLFAAWIGKGAQDLSLFADTLSGAIQLKDVFNILAKSTLPGLFASASCCVGALGIGDSAGELPQATQCALTRSVAGLFVISATVSLLTYL